MICPKALSSQNFIYYADIQARIMTIWICWPTDIDYVGLCRLLILFELSIPFLPTLIRRFGILWTHQRCLLFLQLLWTIDHYCKLSKNLRRLINWYYSLFSSFSELGPICLAPTKHILLLSGLATTTVL